MSRPHNGSKRSRIPGLWLLTDLQRYLRIRRM
jgi:hypothetical protein